MSLFTFTGQDANNTTNASTLVVNSEVPISFSINSGAESYVGNLSSTAFNEAADDRISYTNYSGTVISNASFVVTYEGQANWSNGNSAVPAQFTSKIAVVRITSGVDAGKTYTLIISNPPDPNAQNPHQGSSFYTFKNGNHRAGPNEDGVFCFAEGTRIDTPTGSVAIGALAVGDLVRTADHGALPIRWIRAVEVMGTGRNRPIRFAVGALGPNIPTAPLMVSPAHRMLVSGILPELLFGSTEVLAHAEDLVNDSTIRPLDDAGFVRYFHLMFDQHEIIFANGAAAESFHPEQADDSLSTRRTLDELQRLFPERFSGNTVSPAARPTVNAAEARLMRYA